MSILILFVPCCFLYPYQSLAFYSVFQYPSCVSFVNLHRFKRSVSSASVFVLNSISHIYSWSASLTRILSLFVLHFLLCPNLDYIFLLLLGISFSFFWYPSHLLANFLIPWPISFCSQVKPSLAAALFDFCLSCTRSLSLLFLSSFLSLNHFHVSLLDFLPSLFLQYTSHSSFHFLPLTFLVFFLDSPILNFSYFPSLIFLLLTTFPSSTLAILPLAYSYVPSFPPLYRLSTFPSHTHLWPRARWHWRVWPGGDHRCRCQRQRASLLSPPGCLCSSDGWSAGGGEGIRKFEDYVRVLLMLNVVITLRY